jgi:predicted  nucleic acid-binding Zn-ribbon protein
MMTYEEQIEALQREFKILTEQLNAAKKNEADVADLNEKRLAIFDEITRLSRLHYEEVYNTVDNDEDDSYDY